MEHSNYSKNIDPAFTIVVPNKHHIINDNEAMQLAVNVAQKGAGFVSPNPLVGCVILSQKNEFLSFGFHGFYGGPHAEVDAVSKLTDEELINAKVFVTLEPCSHYGKTPPCADLLCSKRVGEVIYGIADPNPLVSGSGIKKLNNAGIKTILFSSLPNFSQETENDLKQVCEVFLWNQEKKQPFVSLKFAASLDGMIGLKSGESKWITGEHSREYAHFLRATHDIILIGVNTLLIDNPSLNIRHPHFKDKSNSVFILDPNGRSLHFLKTSAITNAHKNKNIYVFVNKDIKDNITLSNFDFNIVFCPMVKNNNTKMESSSNLDLNFILTKAWELGFKSILVEGGAATVSSFLNQRIGNRLSGFMAPIIIGNKNGRSWSENFYISSLTNKLKLNDLKTLRLGDDLYVTGLLEWSDQTSPAIQDSGFNNNSGVNNKKYPVQLYRSQREGVFLGVCQGLGESFGVKPNLLRVIWVLSFFYFFVGLGFYLILALSLPNKDNFDKSLNKQILGVCTVLAKKFNIEIGLVRLLAILSLIASAGIALLVYLILYFSFEEK